MKMKRNRTDHGELGNLPTPIWGSLSDSHMRVVTVDGPTPSVALRRASEYLAHATLDECVAMVQYFHREPGDPQPCSVMVVLEVPA
jgi:hypothetical protein